MSIMLKVGDKIPLRVDFGDGNANLYVQVTFFDKDNIELTDISPVNLTNNGDGSYSDSSKNYPDVKTVFAVYTPYEDDQYTTISSEYFKGSDTFQKTSDVNQEVIDEITRIRELIEQQPDVLDLVGVIDEGTTSSGRAATIYRGETRDLGCKIRYKEFGEYRGDPVPLDNVDEIKAIFVGKNRRVFEKKLTDGDITIVSEAYGKLQIHLTDDDTNRMKLGPNQDFVIEVQTSNTIRVIKFYRALVVRNA